jgi:Coenzyme PQQ synthesis protein D (PqqD)
MVVLDREGELVHQLNRTASFIWDRCDGRRSIRQIGADLAAAFDVDLGTATEDVAATVSQLESLGLVTCGLPPVNDQRRSLAPDETGGSPGPQRC